MGAATRRFAPVQKPQNILYRSYKHFNDANFLLDLQSAPFHVMEIFDDADDMTWYTSTLIRDVIDAHAPLKSKLIKRQSVPYMNSELRKAIYSRNMAQNKFRKFGAKFWSENRRQRNKVVALRKKSMSKYFDNKCRKHSLTRNYKTETISSCVRMTTPLRFSMTISQVLPLLSVSPMTIFLPAELLLFIKITRV